MNMLWVWSHSELNVIDAESFNVAFVSRCSLTIGSYSFVIPHEFAYECVIFELTCLENKLILVVVFRLVVRNVKCVLLHQNYPLSWGHTRLSRFVVLELSSWSRKYLPFRFEYNAETTPSLPLLKFFQFYAFFEPCVRHKVNVWLYVSCLQPFNSFQLNLALWCNQLYAESWVNFILIRISPL
jgi:hypothetical protein